MRIGVLGSGLMGSVAAKYLVSQKDVEGVQLVDKDDAKLKKTARWIRSSKLKARKLDTSDRAALLESIKSYDSLLIALPHVAALSADEVAIDAGVNAVDLVFDDKQMKLDARCRRAGMTLIPGCGVAPGLAQILAGEAVGQLVSVDEIHIYVGGIPQTPRPPLNYRVVFSLDGALAMYADRRVRVVRNGTIRTTAALSEIEPISFSKPFEDLEAFLTDGLASLIYTMRDRVRVMDEKTVRYLGHAEQIKTLIEVGLLSNKSINFNGAKLRPRDILSAVLGPKIMLGQDKDVTLLRVVVDGRKKDSEVQYRYEMVDYYDEIAGITSMARTTAYTGAIAAMILASKRTKQKGVVPPENAFSGPLFSYLMDKLAKKNVKIIRTVTTKTRLQ